MDKKELLDKFCLLFAEVKNSRDSETIEVALHMLKKAMSFLLDSNVRIAKELIECFDGNLKYYNFLTEIESDEVVQKFVHQDGSRGPKWRDSEELFRKIKEMGGKIECEPHYNKWALYVTMNKIASSQNNVLVKWVGDDRDRYFEACYELSVAQLKDRVRPCWIRPYYEIGE